ncbi:ABC transporter substrate-binding protein [Pseudomonas syringae]|uniref:ABC transporter substrate-binding protein n=1 Tax=Pseudomonas syringae TaxID=317 RepID=A0A1C7Z3Y1_PSESX|nr:ABC transporter substrate-binding protein [Pseudomonas syringae]OCR23746.1 ABC transporter substrate-binding protein [Pseudomonas syringae]
MSMDTALGLWIGHLGCIVTGLLLANSACAADVLLTATEDSPEVQAFVSDLAQRRPEDSVRFATTGRLPVPGKIPEHTRLILLDPGSLDWRLLDSQGPATLVLRISRIEAHQRLAEKRPPNLSLLWSDPPVSRQLKLIRQLLPQARQVGVLFDSDSQFLLKETRHAAAPMGLKIVSQSWRSVADNRPLSALLNRSDVLLGLDDTELYNARTAKNLLLSSYAQQLALLGPNAGFVTAGSLASTYSDQHDWLDTLDELLDMPPASWPRAFYPPYFKVVSNPRVARSLGIAPINDAALTASLTDAERQP